MRNGIRNSERFRFYNQFYITSQMFKMWHNTRPAPVKHAVQGLDFFVVPCQNLTPLVQFFKIISKNVRWTLLLDFAWTCLF